MKALCLAGVLALLAACSHSKAAAKDKPAANPAPATAPAAAQQKNPVTAAPRPLFDRLGGLPALETVVTEFVKNVAADERINAPFAVTDLDVLHRRLVEFFCVATGGPCKYSGRNMLEAHRGMGVTGAQFDALATDLVKTLDTCHVPEQEKDEILHAVAPLRKEIVEVE